MFSEQCYKNPDYVTRGKYCYVRVIIDDLLNKVVFEYIKILHTCEMISDDIIVFVHNLDFIENYWELPSYIKTHFQSNLALTTVFKQNIFCVLPVLWSLRTQDILANIVKLLLGHFSADIRANFSAG